jgi:signal transduction histidine kinase
MPDLDVPAGSRGAGRARAVAAAVLAAVLAPAAGLVATALLLDGVEETRPRDVAWLVVAAAQAAVVAFLARALLRRRAADAEACRAQARVAQLGRAGATAELAGWITHELGTPLASMLNNLGAARRLLARPGAATEVAAAVDEALSAGERAAQVMGRMRTAVRVDGGPRDGLDVNDVVREAVRLVESARLAHGVSITADLPPGLARVRGDPVQLLQAAISLLLNAVEAASASRGGKVVVRTSGCPRTVQLVVEDSGAGVSERDRPHLFEPFFTTRPGGLGIGLAMTRSIVEAHGGMVVAERPPSGAAFRVTLPVAA